MRVPSVREIYLVGPRKRSFSVVIPYGISFPLLLFLKALETWLCLQAWELQADMEPIKWLADMIVCVVAMGVWGAGGGKRWDCIGFMIWIF